MVYQFVRLQSTHLEQKLWEKFIQDLDNNLLMKLAMGYHCVIMDCTSRKKKGNRSRACWQGIPWITYCLERVWFNRRIKCEFGMHMVFEQEYLKLSRCTLKKLKYYRKFLMDDKIHLSYICYPTDNDGNEKFYKEIVKNAM